MVVAAAFAAAALLLVGCGGDADQTAPKRREPIGLDGQWRVTVTVLDPYTGGDPVGSASRDTWIIDGSCASGSCPFLIRTRAEIGAQPGTLFRSKGGYTGRLHDVLDCYDEDGQVLGQRAATEIDVYRFSVTFRSDLRPISLTGVLETELGVFNETFCSFPDRMGVALVMGERITKPPAGVTLW